MFVPFCTFGWRVFGILKGVQYNSLRVLQTTWKVKKKHTLTMH